MAKHMSHCNSSLTNALVLRVIPINYIKYVIIYLYIYYFICDIKYELYSINISFFRPIQIFIALAVYSAVAEEGVRAKKHAYLAAAPTREYQ